MNTTEIRWRLDGGETITMNVNLSEPVEYTRTEFESRGANVWGTSFTSLFEDCFNPSDLSPVKEYRRLKFVFE